MVIKYRLHEVAKDLNLQNKDVADLLSKYSDTPKKHMTALTDEELNIVFDYFTQQNQVENFDAYFKSTVKTTVPAAEQTETKQGPVKEKEGAPVQKETKKAETAPAAEAQKVEKTHPSQKKEVQTGTNPAKPKPQAPAQPKQDAKPAKQPEEKFNFPVHGPKKTDKPKAEQPKKRDHRAARGYPCGSGGFGQIQRAV